VTGPSGAKAGATRRCRVPEPSLEDVLAEPATRLLMRSDGVEEAMLRSLLAELRYRLLPLRS
jgi:hypothetical protein